MNILFWNLKQNNIHGLIKQCLLENNISIAVFSEHSGVDFVSLQKEMHPNYKYIEGMGGCEKVALFVSSSAQVAVKREQSRYALYEVSYCNTNYIIVGIHLQDRRSSDTAVRIETIGRLMNDIKNLEQSTKCKNTIIIGDFNANPYDAELLQMNAFHAVLFKDLIRKSETRTVDGVAYRRLYNPILHFLSEDTKNYGSFYYSIGSGTPIWHCLDQVLVSRPLIDSIVSLRYVRMIGEISLIKATCPNKDISDHLPLFVQFS